MTDREVLQSIVDAYDCRSELFTSDEECAANLYDRARKQLAAAAPAQAEPSDKSKLHLAIMNISTDDAASAYQFNDAHARYCYKVGHRDARHAAAELVIANR